MEKSFKIKTLLLVGLTALGVVSLIIRWSEQGHFHLLFSSAVDFKEIKSTSTFAFLLWNLFLAWIPFGLAYLFQKSIREKRKWWISFSVLSLWLLFFPNAPYIITDFLHLRWRHPIPHWYDLMTLLIFAYTGLVLGLSSLSLVHSALLKICSRKLSWVVVLMSILLCGQGVYLGRVLRYNSWDLFHQPQEIILSVLHSFFLPMATPGASMAWMMSVFLLIIYLLSYADSLFAGQTKIT